MYICSVNNNQLKLKIMKTTASKQNKQQLQEKERILNNEYNASIMKQAQEENWNYDQSILAIVNHYGCTCGFNVAMNTDNDVTYDIQTRSKLSYHIEIGTSRQHLVIEEISQIPDKNISNMM